MLCCGWVGMQRSRRELLRTALPFFCLRLRAQQEIPTFSTGVKVVNVLATVTDKTGKIVRDLTKDDFELYEDKRPQTLRYNSKSSLVRSRTIFPVLSVTV